jgi:hypothetical protein
MSGKYAAIHGLRFLLTVLTSAWKILVILIFRDLNKENTLDKITQEKPNGLHLSLNDVLLLYWFAAFSQTGIFRGFSLFSINLTGRQLYSK